MSPSLRSRNDKVDEEELRLKVKEKCFNNLFYFAKYILGYADMNETLHKELCDKVTDFNISKKLFLLPRLHLKTTVITKAFSIWLICRNPNIRILIVSETHTLAKGMLREIKKHFETNMILQWLFPELIPENFEKAKWNESEICVVRSGNYTESTVETAGLDSSVVSRHYDVIIKDDLVSNLNIATQDSRTKVIQWHKDSKNLLLPNGLEYCIGTRWHYYDLYEYMIDKEFNLMTYKRSAIENGLAIFPEKYPLEELERRKQDMGSYVFSMQMQNEPVDDENAVFKSSWIINKNTPPENGLYIVMAIDPADEPENDSKNDYFAIVIAGFDYLNNMHVLEYRRGRWSPKEGIDHIMSLQDKWKPARVGIEKILFSNMLSSAIRDEMRRRNQFFIIEELSHGGRAKESRIRGLQPRYENKTVFHYGDMRELEDELLMFPKGKNDDIIDALAYTLELANIGETPLKRETVTIDCSYSFQYLHDYKKRNPIGWQHEADTIIDHVRRVRGNG